MFPTFVNCLTVIIGSLLGLLIKKRLSSGFKSVVTTSAGIVTLVIGMSMALKTTSFLIMLFSVVIGGLIGYALHLEDHILHLGNWLEAKSLKGKGEGSATFAVGFLNASILFCSGAMSIVGSIQAGTSGDYRLILVKSVLDGSMAIVLAAAYGVGVLFSSLFILVYQGFFTLAGSWLAPLLGKTGINELSAVGGILIIMIAFSLLDIKHFKTADYLLGMFIAPLLVALSPYIVALIPALN